MSGSDQISDVWQGLDRLAFCENAILLELKNKSQGPIITPSKAKRQHPEPGSDGHQHSDAFLDDIALIASADGGRDNVAAACLERDVHEPSGLIVRIARNEGLNEDLRTDLQEIVDMAKCWWQNSAPLDNVDVTKAEAVSTMPLPGQSASGGRVLRKVVQVCAGRVKKHVSGLLGELRHSQCLEVSRCKPSVYKAGTSAIESRSDTALIGAYCKGNHMRYARLINQRMNTLRILCSNVEQTRANDISDLCEVVWTAYTLRHSSLLQYWLQTNLRLTTKSTTLASLIDDIIKRVGKLSRFFRAVVEVSKISNSEVDELQYRSEADLRARGGKLLKGFPDERLRNKLVLWDSYRVHAEIQLIVFYETNMHIERVSDYIGGDKLCCYLCYHFITMHAKFKVNGCHQSLYSLWMVPDKIPGLLPEAADRIHLVLAQLCGLLQDKINQILRLGLFKSPYHPERESCDNLSRASFLTDLDHQYALLQWQLRIRQEQSARYGDQRSSSGSIGLDPTSRDILDATCETTTDSTSYKNHSKQKQPLVSGLTVLQNQTSQTTMMISDSKASICDGFVVANPDNSALMVSREPHPTKSDPSVAPITAASSSKIQESDRSTIYLSRPKIGQQARLLHDLNSQQRQAPAGFMGDHESRACKVPIAHDARTLCAIGTSRKFDFHDLELIFDFEHPNTASVLVKPDEDPTTTDSQIVEVAELPYDQEYVVEFDADIAHERVIFLPTKQKDGSRQWLKLVWDNVAR
ncbi:hypothetical protein LTR70_010225 [Exophiala xenobiotica]|uniref:Uncharacterized protein n=1 Tax=Lithohypha guttulata TaxID=1690604 RepID=A0ABR0JV38_9EURO|nr:hypothetical protein LTR24_010173 [Lithohypha guttulata]KAK5309511.1 hypothetical protein LTR70_010225 [Exophiala xenobiotica]